MAIVKEVRRQFHEIPGLIEDTGQPDYHHCVAISTQSALREIILPSLLAVVVPLVGVVVMGAAALGGLLMGPLHQGLC